VDVVTIALVIVGAVVVILVLSAALADRVCATLAERKASEYLTEPFGHPPTVRVHGTPFLTQALRGRYRDIPSPAAACASARSPARPSTRISISPRCRRASCSVVGPPSCRANGWRAGWCFRTGRSLG
jgi:hypothetical protein